MSIDLNEQPEEYPSHMIEETEDTVAEEPRNVRVVDVETLPPGVTAEQYVEHFQRTGSLTVTDNTDGVTYVDVSTATNSTIGVTQNNLDAELMETISDLVEGGEVKIDEEHGEEIVRDQPQKEAPVEETTRQKRARLRKEMSPLSYQQEAKHALLMKRIKNHANLERIYNDGRQLQSLKLTPDQIVMNDKGEIFHTTFNEQVDFFSGKVVCSITFDKEKNVMSVIENKKQSRMLRRRGSPPPPVSSRRNRVGRRIRKIQTFKDDRMGNVSGTKYIVMNKDMFISSGGSQFRFRKRSQLSFNEIGELRKKAVIAMTQVAEAIEFIKSSFGEALLPEDFEIIYDFRRLEGLNIISVFIHFRDVTIRNSIEMSRYIGDIILKLTMEHYIGKDQQHRTFPYLYFKSLSGTRMTYTAIDAVAGYAHSHLPSMNEFSSFCTGRESYWVSEPNKIELEQLVHRLRSFVEWESLEGGPHYRMEGINVVGSTHSLRTGALGVALPDSQYIKDMISRINLTEQKFGMFSDCFRLVSSGGSLLFEVDRKKFYLTMIEIFDKESLVKMSLYDRKKLYYYKPNEDKFYQFSGNGYGNVIELRREAREKIREYQPMYINGRYIRPRIIDSSDPFEGIRYCPNPEAMYEMVNVILYHLTEKLEKHGNTSEK